LPRLDLRELRPGLVELLLRAVAVDLAHVDGVVDQRERAVLLYLEEAGPGRKLEHLVLVDVDARRPGLEHRDERCVPREDADLAGVAGDDQHLGLALVRRPFRGDERDLEPPALVCHGRARYAATAAPLAFSRAPSIEPTM